MEKNSDRNTHTHTQKYTCYTYKHTSDIHTDENFALCRAVCLHLFLPKCVPKISPYLSYASTQEYIFIIVIQEAEICIWLILFTSLQVFIFAYFEHKYQIRANKQLILMEMVLKVSYKHFWKK